MLEFPSLEKPRFWTHIPRWCSEHSIACSEVLSPARRQMPSLAMPLEEDREFYFPCLWQCVLHCREIEFGWRRPRAALFVVPPLRLQQRWAQRWGLGPRGAGPAPPTPAPLPGLAGVCGAIAHLGLGIGHRVQPAAGTFAGISRVRVYADLC